MSKRQRKIERQVKGLTREAKLFMWMVAQERREPGYLDRAAERAAVSGGH